MKQLWSIIRGHRTNFSWANASWTYYPDGDPMGKKNRTMSTDAPKDWDLLNAIFQEALEKYPHSKFALHYLWNSAIAIGPESFKPPPAPPFSTFCERCPTCNMTDAGYSVYIKGWCRDPWHADDHLRAAP